MAFSGDSDMFNDSTSLDFLIGDSMGMKDPLDMSMDGHITTGESVTPAGMIMLSQLQQNQQQQMMQQVQMMNQAAFNSGPAYPMTPQTPITPMSPFGVPVQQPAPVDPNNRPLVDVIHEACIVQVHMLEQVRVNQKNLIDQVSGQIARSTEIVAMMQQAYQSILADQATIKDRIEKQLNALQELNQTRILPPEELHKLYVLHQELQLQLRQLELYYYELQCLANPNLSVPFAALVVMKDPFPDPIPKNKAFKPEMLMVRLLSNASTVFTHFGPVQATMVSEGHGAVKNAAKEKFMENDVQPMDPHSRTASFPIKFLSGTRMSCVALRFTMQITATLQGNRSIPGNLETPSTRPFLIITNESQWEQAEQLLFKLDAFGKSLEITWPQFCNTLQRHFLRATRQDPGRPRRALSLADFDYVHDKFFARKERVSQAEFDQFWSWFGKTLQVVRYQRHISSLWQHGLIYGFMTREDVASALQDREPSTFIIRFSERYAGQFGIAYIGSPGNQIKHYLVGPNDTAGAKKTLPDFVCEHPQFSHILQCSFDANGRPLFQRHPKHLVLGQYLSPTHAQDRAANEDGYEPLE